MPTEMDKQQSAQWLEFSNLSNIKDLKHASFLKPYDFMSYEDDSELVNKQLSFCKKLLCAEEAFFAKQVHSNGICHIINKIPKSTQEADIIITNKPGIAIGVRHADCQACILFDPISTTLAVIHCGWRGNVLNVYQDTIEYLKSQLGVKPENLLASISPSLGPLAAEFRNYKKEFPESMWQYRDENNLFNLWELAEAQLISSGVLSTNIEIAKVCTYTDAERCHSYRRDQNNSRHATFACIQ